MYMWVFGTAPRCKICTALESTITLFVYRRHDRSSQAKHKTLDLESTRRFSTMHNTAQNIHTHTIKTSCARRRRPKLFATVMLRGYFLDRRASMPRTMCYMVSASVVRAGDYSHGIHNTTHTHTLATNKHTLLHSFTPAAQKHNAPPSVKVCVWESVNDGRWLLGALLWIRHYCRHSPPTHKYTHRTAEEHTFGDIFECNHFCY